MLEDKFRDKKPDFLGFSTCCKDKKNGKNYELCCVNSMTDNKEVKIYLYCYEVMK